MATMRLDRQTIRAIAEEVVRLMKESEEEYITTKEASRLLGISAAWLRRQKGNYPHIKKGEGAQSRLLFLKSAITECL